MHTPKLVIHGGLGNQFDPQLDDPTAIHQALQTALDCGYAILENGGTSLDAVTEAVCALENAPVFNSGTGSVLTKTGHLEMDSAIMDGCNLEAGAVAGLSHIKNPVLCARQVMENTPHIMLIGKHAEDFAQTQGMKLVESDTLITEQKYQAWLASKNNPQPDKLGTVGAVAMDNNGNLAAATSTGGLMHKLPGRVSDSCIIGAGTFADNNTCAVSCTGSGEYFIRSSCARSIADRIQYQGISLDDAVQQGLQMITDLGGEGGIIAIDRQGNTNLSFNNTIMYRGLRDGQQTLTLI